MSLLINFNKCGSCIISCLIKNSRTKLLQKKVQFFLFIPRNSNSYFSYKYEKKKKFRLYYSLYPNKNMKKKKRKKKKALVL